jgi:hypothetical protein
MKSTLASTVLLLGISGFALLGHSRTAEDNRKRQEVVGISLRIDKQEATVGEIVRLEELIPTSSKDKILSVSHDVLRIGRYDTKLGKPVNIDPEKFCDEIPSDTFANLPDIRTASHPMPFEVTNPRTKGIEFEVRPKRLGIFLVKVSWVVDVDIKTEKVARIWSSPVVIVVVPPLDKEGRPVIKEEWLQK